MNAKPTKKRWTRTEWLLLLAPLVVVLGIGAMNFAPQLERAWQEWREYGSNRPYAIIWAEGTVAKGRHSSFSQATFSDDGKYVVTCEERGDKPEQQINVLDVQNKTLAAQWIIDSKEAPFIGHLSFQTPFNVVAEVSPFRYKPRSVFESKFRLTMNRLLRNRDDEMPGALVSLNSYSKKLFSTSTERQWKSSNNSTVINIIAVRKPVTVKSDIPGATIFQIQWKAQRVSTHLTNSFVITQYLDQIARGGNLGQSEFRFRISPDGQVLLVTGIKTSIVNEQRKFVQTASGYFQAFDTETGQLLWTRQRSELLEFSYLAVTFYGSTVAIKTDKAVELRDLRSGNLINLNITGRTPQTQGNDGSMQFSPDGKLLAVPQDDRLELWNVSDLN